MTSVKHRKYTSRTRSGCRTCKIRRVKCDEQRPSCVKCIGSGRVCDGYGIWDRPAEVLSKPRLQTSSVFYPPQSFPGLDQQEKRHLHRFRYFVAGRLAEPLGSHFWSSLVPQISLSEPAVVHASIALSSAYDLFLPDRGYNTSSPVSKISFLLRQYNRAIRALTSKIDLNDSASLRTAAVSSILFICLEILRGDPNAMYAHFGSGVKLLSQLQKRRGGSLARSELVLVADSPQIYDDHLVTVFAQLNLQFLTLGNSSQLRETFITPFYYSRRVHIPPRFRNVVEARRSFTSILLAVTYLCKEFERAILTSNSQIPEPCITEIEKQQALEAAMTEWVDSYERSITSLLASASHGETISLTMLRIYAHTCTIIIGTCLTIKETAYDPYLCEFESILRQYKDSLNPGACKLDPCFTIDMGLFPPLYFTAIKCRNHSVRKQALSLLEQYPTMEGLWTGPMLARAGGYVVDLEEKHFLKALQSPPVAPDSIPTTSAYAVQLHNAVAAPGVVLPEFCRIHCVECKLPSRYSNAPNAALLKLSRFKHELGKSGGWCVITAKVDLSGVRR